jgi:glycosyltransferase involved in cell wall biosynthesis
MAAGLPVVSSSVGANREIFDQYGCQGVCARTKKEFLDGIMWLQNDPNERQRMGTENRKIAEKYFDHKVLSKILAEALT